MPQEEQKSAAVGDRPSHRFGPKLRFLRDSSRAESHRDLVSNPEITRTMQECLTEMAYMGSSREQLDGAAEFIRTFLDFAEPNFSRTQFPIKQLKTN